MRLLGGKIAIVTGTSSGIGLSTAKAFLDAGAKVFGVDLSPAPESIKQANFEFLQANLTQKQVPDSIVASCKTAFGGRIDILVNVAGILDPFHGAATFADEDWDRVIATNLTAPVRLMRSVSPSMRKQKSGSIINVSSKAGMCGPYGSVAYTSSKHGLIGATKNTAWLLKEDGVRCNAVAPGSVETNMLSGKSATKADPICLSRARPLISILADVETGVGISPPGNVADVILFLASDLGRGINGAIIPVDRGDSTI